MLVHLTLAQVRGLPGASAAEDAWTEARASQPGWLTGPDADAALCDATIVPIVTGHVDWAAALDQLTEAFLNTRGLTHHSAGCGQHADTGQPGRPCHPTGPDGTGACGTPGADQAGSANQPSQPASEPAARGCICDSPGCAAAAPLGRATRDRLRRALLGLATDALSGPDGLAARLRAALDSRPLTTISLPLDIGAATETIPAHLRRAPPTLRLPRLRPARQRLRHPPPHPTGPRRPHQPPQPGPPVHLPPPHRDPPVGLDPHPAP